MSKVYSLTTNHPASSHGFPVVVSENLETGERTAFGPADLLPTGQNAADWVKATFAPLSDFERRLLPDAARQIDEMQDMARLFLSQMA